MCVAFIDAVVTANKQKNISFTLLRAFLQSLFCD